MRLQVRIPVGGSNCAAALRPQSISVDVLRASPSTADGELGELRRGTGALTNCAGLDRHGEHDAEPEEPHADIAAPSRRGRPHEVPLPSGDGIVKAMR